MATKQYKNFTAAYVKDSTTVRDYLVPAGTTGACAIVVAGQFVELWFTNSPNPTGLTTQYTQWDLALPIVG